MGNTFVVKESDAADTTFSLVSNDGATMKFVNVANTFARKDEVVTNQQFSKSGQLRSAISTRRSVVHTDGTAGFVQIQIVMTVKPNLALVDDDVEDVFAIANNLVTGNTAALAVGAGSRLKAWAQGVLPGM